MAMSPQQIAEKWSRNTTGATQSMRDGVNAVTANPMEKAAQAQDAYLAGVQRAVQTGKWQAGLRSVTLAQWKDDMINKGIPRISAGVAAAKEKYTRFMTELMAHIGTIRAELEGMPRGDLETNLNRMMFNARRMADFRRSNR